MSQYGFILNFIKELEILIEDWEPCRKDVEWDGGQLNSFLIEIENLIDKERCSIFQSSEGTTNG